MNKKGFTLIELLIVVAIIGIVAAIAIPNLLVAIQKGKQKSSMGELRNLGAAVESYLTDNAIVPNVGVGTVQLLDQPWFRPFYIKIVPIRDAWGTAMQYEGAALGDLYSLSSYGRDKAAGPAAANPWYVTALADFNPDLIFSNGIFTSAPARR